jgi:hypothetical protein
METYKLNGSYEIFSANMTIDLQVEDTSPGYAMACKSCQCQCHLCRGHRAPNEEETVSKVEIENALESLLAA